MNPDDVERIRARDGRSGTDLRHSNPGRPPLEGETMVQVTVRMTRDDWAKLRRIGGSRRLRQMIRRAKETV